MHIYFNTAEGRGYVLSRFLEMSGLSRDSAGYAQAEKAYAEIEKQINMRAEVREVTVRTDGNSIELDGIRIESTPLGAMRGLKQAYVYALTAGEVALSGDTLSRTLEDMWATAFTDACCELLKNEIKAENPGMYVSAPFGPGFYGIKISEIKTLFDLLDCEDIGLSLKNGMIYPIKSSIGFFLVSDKEISLPPRDCAGCSGDASCEYCRNNIKPVKVYFENENINAEVPRGTTLLDAARKAGITVEAPCGGTGKCGKCLAETRQNGDTKIAKMCTERVYSDAVVKTKTRDTKISVEVIDEKQRRTYSLAVDIGTTTLAAELIGDTKTIARANMTNPQTAYAADIVGRIRFAEESDALHSMIIAAVNDMIYGICEKTGINNEQITKCVLSGNTVMQYIVCGKNPGGLGRYPYMVDERFGRNVGAAELGLDIAEGGEVYLPGVISAFVGGDIACGIAYTRLWEKSSTLFIDIGTNGEMALMHEGQLIAASAAAGPAFEGTGIKFGMRAVAGAVCRFKILNRNTVMVETIEKAPAAGICGSGLIDIIGELVKNGIITADGSFCDKRLITSPIRNRLCEYSGEMAFKICGGIYLTQSDVRQVQLTKSAMRAGIEVLADSVDKIIIAGAFGKHASIDSLINIGILPEKFREGVTIAGNTSLEGAKLMLGSEEMRKQISGLCESAETILLSDNEEFERLFVKYMNFETGDD